MSHTVAKGKVENGITEIVLQEGDNLRAVAYIRNDRTGYVQLQQRINKQHIWYSTFTEMKTMEQMKETLLGAGIKFCPEDESFYSDTMCQCKKIDLL